MGDGRSFDELRIAIRPGQDDEWRAIAAAHFSGTIVLGDDLTAADL